MWNGRRPESKIFKSPNSPEINYRIKTVLSRVTRSTLPFPVLPCSVLSTHLPAKILKKNKKTLGAAGPAQPAPLQSLCLDTPCCPPLPVPALGPSGLSLLSQGDSLPHTLGNSARFCFSSLGGGAPGTQHVKSRMLLSTPLCPGRSQGREQSRPDRNRPSWGTSTASQCPTGDVPPPRQKALPWRPALSGQHPAMPCRLPRPGAR